MPFPICLQALVDLVGNPHERELTQCSEVAGAEVVRQCRLGAFGRVDVAVGHAPSQCLGRLVDEVHLVGSPNQRVGNDLALRRPGDALDDVVERFEVLDVDRRDHVDARVEEQLDVLVALRCATPRDVGVGELVDETDTRRPLDDGVDVHLLELRTAIGQVPSRHHLEITDLLDGARPAVGLHHPDDDVGAALSATMSLLQHGVGLAHTRCRAEVDAELTTRHGTILRAGAGQTIRRPRRAPGSGRAR